MVTENVAAMVSYLNATCMSVAKPSAFLEFLFVTCVLKCLPWRCAFLGSFFHIMLLSRLLDLEEGSANDRPHPVLF